MDRDVNPNLLRRNIPVNPGVSGVSSRSRRASTHAPHEIIQPNQHHFQREACCRLGPDSHPVNSGVSPNWPSSDVHGLSYQNRIAKGGPKDQSLIIEVSFKSSLQISLILCFRVIQSHDHIVPTPVICVTFLKIIQWITWSI